MTIKNGEFAVGETTYTAENVGQLWGYVAKEFNRTAADTFRKNFEAYLNGEGNNRSRRTDIMNLLSLSGEQRIGFSEAFSWDYSKGVREDYLTTRDLGAYAKENGYDGVIIKNITDSGGQTKGNPKGTIVIAFEANQIKTVSNETPTKSKDIRYSVPASEGAVNEKTTEDVGGGLSYSIVTLDSGKSYVQASRRVILGKTVAEWRKEITSFFNESLRNGPIKIQTIEGDVLTITKDTADKARSNNVLENNTPRRLSKKEFLVKLHAESHIDELSEMSVKTKQPITPDTKNHEFAKDGFTYRTVYFRDFDGSYYKITLSVGINGDVSTVYNVGKIKTEDIPDGKIISTIGSKADMSSASFSIPESPQNVKEKSSNQNKTKQKQLEIIKKTNPMWDDYHTGIRTVDDIRTWEEVLELNDEREGQFVWGDFSREDAEQALKNGTITVYSSYPIENGVFVSTSYIQAEEYAGGRGGKVYSKTIPITNVAWINGDEGQYAKVNNDLTFSVPASEGEAVTSKSLFNMVQKAKTAFDHSVLFPLRDPTENA